MVRQLVLIQSCDGSNPSSPANHLSINKMQERKEDKILEESVNPRTASDILNTIYTKNTEDNIKIGTILKSIDSGGFALFNLILSLILFIPTPPPIATICGVLIIFLSFQMILGLKEVWLPSFITNKSIKRTTLALIVGKSSIYLSKMEKITRKRLVFMESDIMQRIIGLILLFLAVLSLTPIIFANSMPGISIILISFGMLNKDGLIVIFGFIAGFISIFVVWAIILFGQALILKIIDRFF